MKKILCVFVLSFSGVFLFADGFSPSVSYKTMVKALSEDDRQTIADEYRSLIQELMRLKAENEYLQSEIETIKENVSALFNAEVNSFRNLTAEYKMEKK